MPAVTVENPLALPKIAEPDPAAAARPLRSVTTAPSGFEGEGFPVRRAFAGVDRRHLDPFIHMDQMGEVDYGPGEPKGTAWHPHRGFETVTYMIDGTFQHQDSTGGGGLITNGATQWMTAGGGILHIERPPESLVTSGGLFHGVQLWVNLPAVDKMVAPRYQDIGAERVTLLSSPDGGALVRVIAGEVAGEVVGDVAGHVAGDVAGDVAGHVAGDAAGHVAGHAGPGMTHTPIAMVHATLSPGAQLRLPWRPEFNALAYVLAGHGTVGAEQRPLATGQLAVFGSGDFLVLQAGLPLESRYPTFDVLILGGRPIGEPVAQYGPFVMNTQDELAQAFEDFRAGRMGVIPADHIGH